MTEHERAPRDQADIVDDAATEPVELVHLVPRMGSPLLDHRVVRAPLDPELTVALGPSAWLAVRLAAPAMAAAIAVYMVAGLPAAILVAFVGSAGRLMGRVGKRAQFTFGEGFLPFRAELGWPHGVQEDDDMRWQWTAAPLPGALPQLNRRDLPGTEG
jgi:hypothetical protein